MIKKEQLIWLAGLLDGEGSILLTATYDRNGIPVIKLAVSVGNTNPLIMLEARKLFGKICGHRFAFYNAKAKGNRKHFWSIQATSQADVRVMCKAVKKYLVGKKDQARLMLQYLRFIEDGVTFKERLPFVAKMKALNRFRTGRTERLSSARDLTVRPRANRGEVKVRPASRGAEVAEMSTRQHVN